MTWLLVAALVAAQIAYPLAPGPGLTIAIVVIGFTASAVHALLTRGPRVLVRLLVVTAGGGLAVEALGVATGFPFGPYAYTGALGPRLLGVPLMIPLAWTWMAWPAWLAAGRLTSRRWARVVVGGVGLAAWDLFLDPQMVDAGYWRWAAGTIPVSNYLAWLVVATLMMAALPTLSPRPWGSDHESISRHGPNPKIAARAAGGDGPMYAVYLWTYASSVLAHAVFLDLPRSAVAGGIGMGLVAIPLAVRLARR